MIDEQGGLTNQNRSIEERGMAAELGHRRADTARMAQKLSAESFHQWQKAMTGALALPAAVTMASAAGVLYATAAVERIFELFEISITDFGSSLSREMQQIRRTGREELEFMDRSSMSDSRGAEAAQHHS